MKEAVITAKKKFPLDGQWRSHDMLISDKSVSDEPKIENDPRQVPSIQNYDPQNLGLMNKKTGTARSLMKTTEKVLYQPFDLDALRIAAQDGDIATASRVLDVRPGLSDAQTLYNAAKNGHDAVINLLFALGDFEPDPEPLDDLPPEYSTPILAAIGKDDHLEVIKLFLGNSRFNPARRIRGEMYFDIAARRAGSNWQEEVAILKNAYEAHQNMKNSTRGMVWSSGPRRDKRVLDLDSRNNISRENFHMTRKQRHKSSSTTKHWGPKKLRHRKRSSTNQYRNWSNSGKKFIGRSVKDNESNNAHSEPEDRSMGLENQKSLFQQPISEPSMMSEYEPVTKPRRKLVSRRFLNYERGMEKQTRKRNPTITSIAAWNFNKESSDRIQFDTKYERSEREFGLIEKQTSQGSHDLFKNEKESNYDITENADREENQSEMRNGSKNHFSLKKSKGLVKKFHSNEWPSHLESHELSAITYGLENNIKKRKKNESENSVSHSADVVRSFSEKHPTLISNTSQETKNRVHNMDQAFQSNQSRILKFNKPSYIPRDAKNCDRSTANNLSTGYISISSNDSPITKLNNGFHNVKLQDITEAPNLPLIWLGKYEDETYDHTHIKMEKQALGLVTQNDSDKPNEPQQIEDNIRLKSALKKSSHEQQDKTQHVGESLEEEEQTQETESQKRAHDEKRPCSREQERLNYEEKDHRIATILVQQHVKQIWLEDSQREKRSSELPLLLKWFDQTPEPKTVEIAKLFSYILGYRFDTVNTKAIGKHRSDDQWMLNTHAAILLGEKDLQLSRYTAWERVFLTTAQKRGVWNSCNGAFLLLDGSLSCLRKQLPFDPIPMHDIIEINRRQFLDLNLFFIKVVEFMYVVPNFPHLRGIEMAVLYRELHIPRCVSSSSSSQAKTKWDQETRFNPTHDLVPSPKYYTNGVPSNRLKDPITRVLRKPPSPDTYPRRMGLTRVYPWDSDYEKICKHQNSCKIKTPSLPLNNLPQSHEISS